MTTFAEAGGQHVDAMGRAVQETGVRAILTQCTMDQGAGLPAGWVHGTDQCLDRQCALFDRWHGAAGDRIRMWFGLRTLFNCSDELATRTKELADARGVGINMHLAEIVDEVRYIEKTRGAPSVHHLAALGVLGANLLAAHCVWLDPREIDLFLLHDVKVSHCPAVANSMHASNVTDSMCDGSWLMRGRRLVTIDEEDVLREAQQRAMAARARAGIELPARYPVIRRPAPD